jgi:hypothetical protein
MRSGLKWYLKASAWIVGISAFLFLAPLLVGVWLPDIGGERHVIAEERNGNAESVRVIQFWNHVDFYSTELEYVGTNGVVQTFTLDGDDVKTWGVPIEVNWGDKVAKVTLRGGRIRRVDIKNNEVVW